MLFSAQRFPPRPATGKSSTGISPRWNTGFLLADHHAPTLTCITLQRAYLTARIRTESLYRVSKTEAKRASLGKSKTLGRIRTRPAQPGNTNTDSLSRQELESSCRALKYPNTCASITEEQIQSISSYSLPALPQLLPFATYRAHSESHW